MLSQFALELLSRINQELASLSTGEAIIFELASILILSAIFAFFARILRQPLIPAYVLTGLVIGPLVLGIINKQEIITAFSEIGIGFLLFVAGLEISFKKIKEANLKKILLIGFLEIIVIVGLTFVIKSFIGLDNIQAVYIGIILAFSSTMVDVKLLADSGKIITLGGRLVLGILLLQDLVAILSIIVLTETHISFLPIIYAILKLLGFILFAFLFQKSLLNRLFKFAATSSELLLLSAVSVLFLFIIGSYLSGISIIIGSFIAGVSLANSAFKTELESRISPLRDFFAVLFFVALGTQIVFSGLNQQTPLLIALLVGALIVKPLVLVALLRIFGYPPKTSLFSSLSLAQLSEFSLILGMLGLSLNVLNQPMFSTIILATIITMSFTPYFINAGRRFYFIFKHPLDLFKFLPIREKYEYHNTQRKEILLVGAHRMGSVLLKDLMRHKAKLIVIDYNPEIIKSLIEKKISCIYGEVSSPDLLKKIDLRDLKTVISTIPSYEENLYLLKEVKKENPRVKVILTGTRISETLSLYENGADYVITPKILAGEKLKRIISSKKSDLTRERKRHLKRLRSIHNLLY